MANTYPPNNGFVGKPSKVTIQEGTELWRYGGAQGKFVTTKGTPASAISLPPNRSAVNPTDLTVLKPIKGVKAGTAAAWYGQEGGGIQYLLRKTVDWYIKHGYIGIG